MARWAFNQNTFTPVAVADTTAFTSAGFVCLQGGSSTQRINCLEFFLGGQATSSTVNQVAIARDTTVGVTLSGGNGTVALDPATAALAAPPVGFSTASTKPQRGANLYLLSPTFNAFGGIVRWVAAPGEEIGMLGNTANFGEISISNIAGTGPMSAHIIFEPF